MTKEKYDKSVIKLKRIFKVLLVFVILFIFFKSLVTFLDTSSTTLTKETQGEFTTIDKATDEQASSLFLMTVGVIIFGVLMWGSEICLVVTGLLTIYYLFTTIHYREQLRIESKNVNS